MTKGARRSDLVTRVSEGPRFIRGFVFLWAGTILLVVWELLQALHVGHIGGTNDIGGVYFVGAGLATQSGVSLR
jgi:hypothetical protein